jgi:hypothetical protein
MNCPYCDESISLAAKFCPKCGLPLKEDTTLMGASWGGDASPNRWLIGAGAAAIVAVALSIGWISTHGQDGAATRRYAAAPSGFPLPGSVTPYAAPSGFSGSAQPLSASRFSPSPVFNMASSTLPESTTHPAGWKPLPPLATVVRNADDMPSMAPEAPRVDITVDRNRRREASTVTSHVVVKPEVAEVPVPPPFDPNSVPRPAPLPGAVVRGADNAQWVYDPVQDSWAKVPSRRGGSATGSSVTMSYPAGTPGLARIPTNSSLYPGLYPVPGINPNRPNTSGGTYNPSLDPNVPQGGQPFATPSQPFITPSQPFATPFGGRF